MLAILAGAVAPGGTPETTTRRTVGPLDASDAVQRAWRALSDVVDRHAAQVARPGDGFAGKRWRQRLGRGSAWRRAGIAGTVFVPELGCGQVRAGAAVSRAGPATGGSDHQPARRRDGDDRPDPARSANHGQRDSGRAAAVRAGDPAAGRAIRRRDRGPVRTGRLLSAGWLAQAVLAGLLALWLPPLGALLTAVFVLALIDTPLSAAVGRCMPAMVAGSAAVSCLPASSRAARLCHAGLVIAGWGPLGRRGPVR